jgi:hypothetical protein
VRDLDRVRSAILNEVGHLDAFATDWGSWDDTYAFVAKPDDAYIEANLTQAYFESGNFSAAYYVDLRGHVVWGMARDPDNGYQEKTIAELAGTDWSLAHPLLANGDLTKGVAGRVSCAALFETSRAVAGETRKVDAPRDLLRRDGFFSLAS